MMYLLYPASEVLDPVLGSPGQERHGLAEERPTLGHKDD